MKNFSFLIIFALSNLALKAQIYGPTELCGASTEAYSYIGSPAGPNLSYEWFVSGTANNLNCGISCNSRTVNVSWSISGSLILIVTDTMEGVSETYSIYVSVNNSSPQVDTQGDSRCGMGGPLILSVVNPSGEYEWYENIGEPAIGIGGVAGTNYQCQGIGNSSLKIFALSETRTFYVKKIVACNSIYESVEATIYPIPSKPVSVNKKICYNSSAILTANGATSGESYLWYDGTTVVSTQATFTTPVLTSPKTYSVSKINQYSCEGLKQDVSVSLYEPLAAGQINGPEKVCYNNNVGLLGNIMSATGGSGSYSYQWQKKEGSGSWINITDATGKTCSTAGKIKVKTYYRRRTVDNNGCDTKYSNIVTVDVDDLSYGGVLSSDGEAFGSATGQLTLSEYNGNDLLWHYKVGTGNWISFANPGTTFDYSNITQTTSYMVSVTNGVCPPDASSTATVHIYDIPSIVVNGPTHICPGEGTQLIASDGFNNYKWKRNGVTIDQTSSNVLNAQNPGTYQVTVEASPGGPLYTTEEYYIYSSVEDQSHINYVTSVTFKKAGIDENTSLYDLNISDYHYAVGYYDGFGRPIRNIEIKNSPAGGNVITIFEYDDFGRNSKDYLPYVSEIGCGTYHTSDVVDQAAFYQTARYIANTDYAYAAKVFERSPLNRVVEQGAPGEAWQPVEGNPQAGKTVKFEYVTNTSEDKVKSWYIGFGLLGNTLYDPTQLTKTITTDEEDHQTIEFVDKLGQTILKRVQVHEPEATTEEWADTYYIYDDFGNLRFVLPPMANQKIAEGATIDDPFLAQWAFCYKYDGRKRMIEKRVPGADWVYMVYDNRDRLVLTQDGNQRKHLQNANLDNEWTFTKYDALNRPISTGILTDANNFNQADMQVHVNGRVGDEDAWYETRGTTVHGYTDQSYPTGVAANTYLTVTYYDDYTFKNLPDFGTTYNYSVPTQLGSQTTPQGT
ncbi:DUF6443 domain-containing protein, partial [Fulvivirga imtechensis]|uniref:DUF6443 domain-containing protein n=1 Tax=Fulvivirga imtechensis TaxID=881893 RepID=UPI001C88DE5B